MTSPIVKVFTYVTIGLGLFSGSCVHSSLTRDPRDLQKLVPQEVMEAAKSLPQPEPERPLTQAELYGRCIKPSKPGKVSHCEVLNDPDDGKIVCGEIPRFSEIVEGFAEQVCSERGNFCTENLKFGLRREKSMSGRALLVVEHRYPPEIEDEAKRRALEITDYDDAGPCGDRVKISSETSSE